MNVVVTGASSGVGFELVKKMILDERITKVIGIARRADRLEELAGFAASQGSGWKFIPVVRDVWEVQFEDIADHLDSVQVLINNAGMLINERFIDIAEQDFEQVYRTNVFAPARLIRLVWPLMKGVPSSHIVNIGSMGGFQGSAKFPGLTAYSSSKSAIAGLSECLAQEFNEDNIKVNCLAFGAVQTEMLAHAFPDFQAPINAQQMAEFVLEFSLTGHLYFNGKVIPVSSTTP